MTEQTSTNAGHCPLCLSDNWRSRKRFPLYDRRVCKKCYYALANRRQIAFVLDLIAVELAAGLVLQAAALLAPGFNPPSLIWSAKIAAVLAFAFKDGFAGHSPGKFLLGIQVVNANTMEPIGFAASFLRNIPILAIQGSALLCEILTPLLTGRVVTFFSLFRNLVRFIPFLVMGYQLKRGPRWGDGLAKTKVIVKKQRFRVPFDTRGLVCQNCGYNLTGNVSGFCTECGKTIPHDTASPPADAASHRSEAPQGKPPMPEDANVSCAPPPQNSDAGPGA